jgi:hypothetical protein
VVWWWFLRYKRVFIEVWAEGKQSWFCLDLICMWFHWLSWLGSSDCCCFVVKIRSCEECWGGDLNSGAACTEGRNWGCCLFVSCDQEWVIACEEETSSCEVCLLFGNGVREEEGVRGLHDSLLIFSSYERELHVMLRCK